ncbi:hypothetical protein L0U85_00090 [Glycomyces sp. L485]|uniref:hypothetical protein n=1 Tax=Glycomyces sp. L485 TaxID=2909235 RepID=UPI001F4B8AA3|nr:hypothetical protein [Glycomyces sp. L485]MCH7229273.1 hypothetical protein [Glycomyces sp. L485]
MRDDRKPYSDDEKETFGYIDDEEESEESLEDEILDAEDYQGADRYGTTPAEEQLGVPLDEGLAEEEPDEPAESVTDEWEGGPDPQAGELHDQEAVWAEESPAAGTDQSDIHITEDDRERAESLRESWEEGPPPDPTDDEALDEDRDQEPGPDDWR